MGVFLSFNRKYPWITKGLLATPTVALISLPTILGEGPPNTIFFKITYPYTFFAIAGFQVEDNTLMSLIILAGLFLYILYGLILTIADKQFVLKATIRVLIITHVIASTLCIILLP